MRWIVLVLLLLLPGAVQADWYGTTPPGIATFNGTGTNTALVNPTVTGGTINNTVIGNTTPAAGTFTTLGAAPGYPIGVSASRFPTSRDAPAYPQYQGFWLNPDKSVWLNNAPNTVPAAWMGGVLSGGFFYKFAPTELPCDIGTAIHCVGQRVLRSGYTGSLIQVTRASDGTSLGIGAVSGQLDTVARDQFCNLNMPDICRIGIEYGQATTDYNDTATIVPLTTNAASLSGGATTTGAINNSVTTVPVSTFANFPPSGSYKVMIDPSTASYEELLVTAGQGTLSWTVTRAQGGTTAVSHNSGAQVVTVLSFAATTGVQPGMIVDVSGTAGVGCTLQHAMRVTTDGVVTRTYDGEYGCTTTSTNGVLFSYAMKVNPDAMVGIVPAADGDYPNDPRFSNEISGGYSKSYLQHEDINSSVTFDTKNVTYLHTGAAYHPSNGVGLVTFYSSGIASNSVGIGVVSNYFTQAAFPQPGGSLWTVGFVNKILPGRANYLAWLQMVPNGANSTVSGGFNEITYATVAAGGSTTVAGGAVGAWLGNPSQNSYNTTQYGNQIVGPRVLYSPALTAPQLSQARASMIAATQMSPQQEDLQVVIADPWPQLSVPYWTTPLKQLHPEWRFTDTYNNNGTNCAIPASYTSQITNQINANIPNRVMVFAVNPNDYVGSNDPSPQVSCIQSLVTTAVASGQFRAVFVLGYPLASGGWGGQTTYNVAVEASVASNIGSWGGVYINLSTNALINTYTAGSAVSNTGFDFTQYAYNVMAPVIAAQFQGVLQPTISGY